MYVYRSERPPWNSRNVLGKRLWARTSTDNPAAFRFSRMLAQKHLDVPRIGQRWPLGPFDLDGDQTVLRLDDEVDLRAVLRAQVVQAPFAEIAKVFSQFDADPLLEKRPGLGLRGVQSRRQSGRGVSHAEVGKEETRGGKQVATGTAAEPRHRKADEHVLQRSPGWAMIYCPRPMLSRELRAIRMHAYGLKAAADACVPFVAWGRPMPRPQQ